MFRDLGRIDYKKAWDYQQALLAEVIERKRQNRNLQAHDPNYLSPKHYLVFCEHPPVYTLGKSGSPEHLLLDEDQLKDREIGFYKINRGGDITYHGPGQVVGYPIFDLDLFFTDIHRYIRLIEEVMIRTCAEYGVPAQRIEGYTGVWIKGNNGQANRKIGAIGVHLSRWVTMHGFAFNANTKLEYFQNIVPCGIRDQDKVVSSLARELGKTIELNELKNKMKAHFASLFEFELLE